MDIIEIQQTLDSISILVDTREQDTKRARSRYESFGVPYKRATLAYGDYAYNAVLPDGHQIYDPGRTIMPQCVVERKMSLDELANCFTHSRDRFRREFERAKEAGARVYLVCENASWENLINGKYRSRFNPNAFVASITAYMARYGMTLIFCKEESSGRIIKEILYRELKERLENGTYQN